MDRDLRTYKVGLSAGYLFQQYSPIPANDLRFDEGSTPAMHYGKLLMHIAPFSFYQSIFNFNIGFSNPLHQNHVPTQALGTGKNTIAIGFVYHVGIEHLFLWDRWLLALALQSDLHSYQKEYEQQGEQAYEYVPNVGISAGLGYQITPKVALQGYFGWGTLTYDLFFGGISVSGGSYFNLVYTCEMSSYVLYSHQRSCLC